MGSVRLELSKDDATSTIRRNLSAVVAVGNYLWLGGDEGTYLERLRAQPDGSYGDHERIDLNAVLTLPVPGLKSELDIEGLAVDSGFLWLVGSHSIKRRRPEASATIDEFIEQLGRVSVDGNRFTLALLPISPDGSTLSPGLILRGDEAGNLLTHHLRADKLLGPFVPPKLKAKSSRNPGYISSKENGLDIEGLAVRGNRVFIGCRGPVLRGWAIIIEARLVAKDHHDGQTLDFAEPLRKHVVDLDGLGIRDLVVDGDDLLVLAGPTMLLDGPVRTYRYRGALQATTDAVVGDLDQLFTVPHVENGDHAEGMTLVTSPTGRRVLIVFDSPSQGRLGTDGSVTADTFSLI